MSSVAKRNIAPISTLVFVSLSGIFFGFFSCGGYVWHSQLFYLVVAVLILATFIYPASYISKLYKKLIFLIFVAAIYFVFESSASAFHPAAPESFSEFIQSFWQGLEYGPC